MGEFKHLKKYNESVILSTHDIERIFNLNLEDNIEFDIDYFDIEKINDNKFNIIISEDFSNNVKIATMFDELYELYSLWNKIDLRDRVMGNGRAQLDEILNYRKKMCNTIDIINSLMLYKLSKKYEFVVEELTVDVSLVDVPVTREAEVHKKATVRFDILINNIINFK